MSEKQMRGIYDKDRKVILGWQTNASLDPLNIRVTDLGEMQLAQSDAWIDKDINYRCRSEEDYLFFTFLISGTIIGDCEGLFSTREFSTGHASGWYTPGSGGNVCIPGGQRMRRLSLAISNKFINERIGRTSNCLPVDLVKTLDGARKACWHEPFKVTPWMKSVLAQMADNPYSGKLEKIFLESRCLELMVHCLEESCKKKGDYSNIRLNSADIERIHFARDLLFENMDNPPSITSLARQVGLNETKLKRGFKIIFDSTIFAYLRNHRMQQARDLLSKGDMNVSEVAYYVGYTNLSNFSKIFCQSFGVLPRTFLREAKDRATYAVLSSL